MYNNIIIDKGILPLSGKSVTTDYGFFAEKIFAKYFGSTIRFQFDKYKYVSFKFEIHGSNQIEIKRGFGGGFNEFVNFLNGRYSNGSNYTTDVELTLFLEIDKKIPEPTIYAKNGKIGQYAYRNSYRHSKFVDNKPGSNTIWNKPQMIGDLNELWYAIFGEELTTTFIQNHPKEMKQFFWLKRDNDRMGVAPVNAEVETGGRLLYNSTDSDPSSDSLSFETADNVQNWVGHKPRLSSTTTPKYFILRNTDSFQDIAHAGRPHGLDWSDLTPTIYRKIAGEDYSVINVHGIEMTYGGKTYRALHITPVGVDTLYFDDIDYSRYDVYAFRKYPNGNIRLTPFSIYNTGRQRQGRVRTGTWYDADVNDTSAISQQKDMGEIYFLYRDKQTGLFSPLSSSKLRIINDKRFRVPVFNLVS